MKAFEKYVLRSLNLKRVHTVQNLKSPLGFMRIVVLAFLTYQLLDKIALGLPLVLCPHHCLEYAINGQHV